MPTLYTTMIQSAKDADLITLFQAYFKDFSMTAPPVMFDAMDKDVKAHDNKILMGYEQGRPIGFACSRSIPLKTLGA